ncbi:sporulation protein [Streptomyces spiramenti]|uniref:Sporulation protein n=1 Tax=Streptomyces spiramenti TaxID=2720606 RepID=A0ABX1APU6_9ACTN|nr:sporulation protein [Streptomyces spiramenti]NJP69104.1 sporulation protein [Streptomyces spiramenti]
MVFKRLLGTFGVGGPKVDTVLSGSGTPGGTVQGDVHVQGGEAEFEIQQIVLELVATPQQLPGQQQGGGLGGGMGGGMGGGDQGGKPVVFGREVVAGGFRIAAGEKQVYPFSMPLPAETPFNELYGQHLGLELGVRTELAIAAAKDSGDMDPLTVSALPAQETALEALGQLGFGFAQTVLLPGLVTGAQYQELPFHQELMLSAAPQYADQLQGLDVTLVAGPHGVDVVLEADKHLSGGVPMPFVRHSIPHAEVTSRDWQTEIDGWVQELLEQRQEFLNQMQMQMGGMMPGMHPGMQQGMHPGMQQQRRGGGAGMAVAAGAAGLGAGVLGGMMLNEAFSGDDEEDLADDGGDDE